MDSVRKTSFKKAVAKPKEVMDSRFGHKKLYKNDEKPSIAVWNSPGRGPNGESQN